MNQKNSEKNQIEKIEQLEDVTDTLSDVMNVEYNYLSALQKNQSLDEMKSFAEANYSDFTMGSRPADEGSRQFLDELQEYARRILEERQLEGNDRNVNAQICIKLSKDSMVAWIFIFPPENEGRDISEDLIWEALNQCRVFFGISDPEINRIVRKNEYFKVIEIARGIYAKEGTEGIVEDHYPRIEKNDQDLDYNDVAEVNWLHSINPGDVICDVVFPIASIPGRNVSGDVLEGKEILPLDLPMGSNVILNEARTALVSKIKGTLYYRHGKFEVKNVVNILSDVGSFTGNIDTIGNLEILGDVTSGFSVQATGNITIRGMVGNSTIIAGGDITIGMGIKGNGGALLRAAGNIDCKYMENCTARAKGKIHSGSIINCEVFSNQEIDAKTIVGGSITALRKIHAGTIGNPQRRQTVCYLGLTQETLQERVILEDRIRELEDAVRQQVKSIRFLKSQKKLSNDQEDQYWQLKLIHDEYQREIQECTEELKLIEQVIQEENLCELEANRVFPPVKVILRSDSLMIDREQSMCRVWSDNGEIRTL